MTLVSCLTCAAPGRPPEFLERCRLYVGRFVGVQVEHLVQEGPSMPENLLALLGQAKGEYLAIIEDDDWYSPDYLWQMVGFLGAGAVIGLDPTVYYHLPDSKFLVLPHPGRSSLFTVVGQAEVLRACLKRAIDEDRKSPFVDLRLWVALGALGGTVLSGLAVGIKHGWGPCYGQGHSGNPSFSWQQDQGRQWLRRMVGTDDADFYAGLAEKYSVKPAEMEDAC